MLTLPTTLAPTCSPSFQSLLAPSRTGAPTGVEELARIACPLMLRWAYNWSQASLEVGVALVSTGPAELQGDDFALLSVPLKTQVKAFSSHAFLFEIVRDGATGQWRMAYAPGGTLCELTGGQTRQVVEALARLLPEEQILVTSYWD